MQQILYELAGKGHVTIGVVQPAKLRDHLEVSRAICKICLNTTPLPSSHALFICVILAMRS